MNARTATAYELQINRALGAVRSASRGAWLAGLGAVARVRSTAPRYFASLVREGERFEGRAKRTAGALIASVKSSPGYAAVRRAARQYVGRLQKVYGETASAVRARIGAAARQDTTPKRAPKRAVRGTRARTKRAA
jgi:poly(hydroxyalkanoate) granule-associated protein